MTRPSQPTLPGFEPEHQADPTAGYTRAAVVATIQSLADDSLLEPRHAAICQLAVALAESVDRSLTVGRPSGTAMVARELRETLAALPAPTQSTAEDKFDDWLQSLNAAAAAQEQAAGHAVD